MTDFKVNITRNWNGIVWHVSKNISKQNEYEIRKLMVVISEKWGSSFSVANYLLNKFVLFVLFVTSLTEFVFLCWEQNNLLYKI